MILMSAYCERCGSYLGDYEVNDSWFIYTEEEKNPLIFSDDAKLMIGGLDCEDHSVEGVRNDR